MEVLLKVLKHGCVTREADPGEEEGGNSAVQAAA